MSRGNIIFCLNVFQEEMMLPECLESIRRYFPEAGIVAVDGAYANLVKEVQKLQAHYLEYRQPSVAESLDPFTKAVSTDATHDILRQFCVDELILPEKDGDGNYVPWAHEYVKRSKYFIGEEGDWYFVLDADERIEGRFDYNSLEDDAYNIMLGRLDDNLKPYQVLRVFRHQDGMRYYGAHHALWVGDVLFRREMCKTIDGLIVWHKQVWRTKKDPIRTLARGAYYRQLTSDEESAFRTQYHL